MIQWQMLCEGSILEMYSTVSNSCWHHADPSSIFQYKSPGSSAFSIAGQRKQIPTFTPPFQLALNCQISLWNSQSPRHSTSWNWCFRLVIHVPARSFSASERGLLPGLLLGLIPWYRQFKDQTTHLSTALTVRFLNRSKESQLHSKNLEYRIDCGLNMGIFRKKQRIFSNCTFVISCAESPYMPRGTLCLDSTDA